jgi:hypothetical protein
VDEHHVRLAAPHGENEEEAAGACAGSRVESHHHTAARSCSNTCM